MIRALGRPGGAGNGPPRLRLRRCAVPGGGVIRALGRPGGAGNGPPRLRLRRCAAPKGGVIRALGRPGGANGLRMRSEAANVEMNSGRMRITRMKHERHAHCLPGPAGELGALRSRRRRQGIPDHVREEHTAAFEYGAVFDRARDAAAALRACPLIAAECTSINRLETRDDALVQAKKIRTRNGKIHGRSPAECSIRDCATVRESRCRCDIACRRNEWRKRHRTPHAAPAGSSRRAPLRKARVRR